MEGDICTYFLLFLIIGIICICLYYEFILGNHTELIVPNSNLWYSIRIERYLGNTSDGTIKVETFLECAALKSAQNEWSLEFWIKADKEIDSRVLD